MSFLLSVCIPTYNRSIHLNNCLNSIASSIKGYEELVEVCISDNGSDDDTPQIINNYMANLKIVYNRFDSNLGIPRNFIKVISIASGIFVWLLGDDDLLLPETFEKLLPVLKSNSEIDYFFVNSYHLTTDYVMSFPQPFDTKNLPSEMIPFSLYTKTGKFPFLKLIDPKVSFDFLGGMFLAVFKREMWQQNVYKLDTNAIQDMRTFSHFDNTFPHVRIFANAFSRSMAYFHTQPLSVCLTGAREWSPMYPLIHSVRMVEALEIYRQNGLSLGQYLYCRNFALNNFISDVGAIIIYRETSGYQYINLWSLFLKNALFPNTYLSLFYFIFRKVTSIFRKK
jgi:glycosyltransferase involved in cell wall biosynthesis